MTRIGSVMVRDKNKSLPKVKGIGPIYYLNLDGQPERREFMEEASSNIGRLIITKRISSYMMVERMT